MKLGPMFALLMLAGVASGCGGEEPTPINLGGTSTTANTMTDADVANQNSDSSQMVEDAANQQCLDDPTKEEGVVRIVNQETGEVVNEHRVDCESIRLLESDGVLGE